MAMLGRFRKWQSRFKRSSRTSSISIQQPLLIPFISQTHSLKPQNLPFSVPTTRPHLHFGGYSKSKSLTTLIPITRIKSSVHQSYGTSHSQVNGDNSILNGFKFDDFLSILELLSVASSTAISVYVALSRRVHKCGIWGSRIFVWQCAILVCCVVIGAVIRHRQWRRICGPRVSRGIPSSHGADLLGRMEKMEADLRSSATIIRVLSRQIEKISIRVRATRKDLQNPIAESASLAQRNSESTRSLATQQEILEKEISETHKVLLAMQEQQQKQLELILAIAKASKLLETKSSPGKDQKPAESFKPTADVHVAPVLESKDVGIPILQEQTSNKRA